MYSYKQFILYELRPTNTGKDDKIPLNPQSYTAGDAHDSSIWRTFEEVQRIAALSNQWGVGFVFTEQDPYFFVDIDECLVNGQWSQWAQYLCSVFTGCFVEVSTSGNGIHIIGRYSGARPEHGCTNKQYGCELYTKKRFVALTLDRAAGSPEVDATQNLQWLITNYFPPSAGNVSDEDWTYEPCPEWHGIEDDIQLLDKMLSSRSGAAVFGGRASVQDLWNASDNLGTWFPDPKQGRAFNWSDADAALCQHLAFWTGKNCERMDRIFRMSKLMRGKWDERGDYRRRTILGACSVCSRVYGEGRGQAQPPQLSQGGATDDPPGQYRSGLQIMSLSQQLEYFKGCVYVRDVHRMWTPDGALLKPEQFKAMYGGYLFSIDVEQSKNTKNAWEAFTESRGLNFSKCNSVCFRPEFTPGAIIYEEDSSLLNTYIPINTPIQEGDPSPFVDHIARMVPDYRDLEVLLSYIAALVQYPGIKFQWCPVIQGIEGNGKSMIITALAHAVGWRYTHLPNSQDLKGNGNTFNSWIQRKLFIGMEEVFVNDRREVIEILKTFVTNPRLEVQAKGVDQIVGDNRANFVMCTNHKDAILKTRRDRRYCIFFTAQQNPADMMPFRGRYFPDLYEWLRREGYAIVNWYLRQYKIPDELNPATSCQTAPATSSTPEALSLSLGRIEQEVIEAVENGRMGFRGGWLSSAAFDSMLQEIHYSKISYNKRREIIESLGYIPHPGLPNGRSTQFVTIDRGKPRLYVKRGHISINVRTPADIIRFYLEAQEKDEQCGSDTSQASYAR